MHAKFCVRPLILFALVIIASLTVFTPSFAGARNPDSTAQLYAWLEVGSGSASGGGISNISKEHWFPTHASTITPNGNLIIAWADNSSGNAEIYVLRWDGESWVEMGNDSASGGGISNNSGKSSLPSLAVSPDGTPIVAWHDDSGGNDEIYVRRWDGTSWVEMGSSSASGGGISSNNGNSTDPSLAVGQDGTTAVAWHDDSGGNGEIYIRRWDGTSWVEIGSGSASGGGISNNSTTSYNPSLAIGQDGNPIVAWSDEVTSIINFEIYIRRWDGTSWVEMGSGSASGGGISNNHDFSGDPSLAIGQDGSPIIAWWDLSNDDGVIYVRRWDGTSWAEMGSGSATGGGITGGKRALSPSLAVDPDGTPIISSSDLVLFGAGVYEIYVRRWDGTSWVGMGKEAASGRGISETSGDSNFPALAIKPDGNPIVSWVDNTSGKNNVYVRGWQPFEPPAADFQGMPTEGDLPLYVQFTNLSSGDFDKCLWDFGDESRSESCANPTHTYSQRGSYTVSLMVQVPGYPDTLVKSDYIKVATWWTFLPGIFHGQ